MTFWTSLGADPKRQYRFQVTIAGMGQGSATYYIKSVQKPGLKISSKEHMYLGHKFHYPGLVTWDPPELNIKMIDPVNPDAAANLTAILQASGYLVPKDENTLITISKRRASESLGAVVISVLDEAGSVIEKWTLQNPFVTGIKFGELGYDKEDLSELELSVKYDWCILETLNAADGAPLSQITQTTGTPANPTRRFEPE